MAQAAEQHCSFLSALDFLGSPGAEDLSGQLERGTIKSVYCGDKRFRKGLCKVNRSQA